MRRFEKHDYAKLAETYGTPFYLYDMDEALLHRNELAAGLPKGVVLLYCMKANGNAAVMGAFKDSVWGVDISSGGEIELAMNAGYTPDKMSFAGPGKTNAELERAVDAKVHLISVESKGELERLYEIAKAKKQRMTIALRINPLATAKAFTMRMGGLPSQFGIAEEDVDPVFESALAKKDWLDFAGIHIFSGTQCLEVDAIVENINQTLGIAKRLSERFKTPFRLVNLGGGFGIPYFTGQEAMNTKALGEAVGKTLSNFRATEPAFAETKFILELGRFLIGMFGIYVSRVVDVKETRGKRFLILDGGMHHVFPATGNFGQLVKKNYPVRNLTRPTDSITVAQEVVGPLCTPMDHLARDLAMPAAEVGDLVGFLQCGAYSYSASPLLFLGHATPPEVVFAKGAYAIGRPRRSAALFA
jgi:diaminopimelate decarboxylase